MLLDNLALGAPGTVADLVKDQRVTLMRGDILRIHELYDAFAGADGVFAVAGAGERALSEAAIIAKFMAAATMTLAASQAERVCEAILALDTLPLRIDGTAAQTSINAHCARSPTQQRHLIRGVLSSLSRSHDNSPPRRPPCP